MQNLIISAKADYEKKHGIELLFDQRVVDEQERLKKQAPDGAAKRRRTRVARFFTAWYGTLGYVYMVLCNVDQRSSVSDDGSVVRLSQNHLGPNVQHDRWRYIVHWYAADVSAGQHHLATTDGRRQGSNGLGSHNGGG